MGYRDDSVALESRCRALQQERDRLRGQLSMLEAERDRLEQEVLHQRWRLRTRLALARAGHHKRALLLLLVAILGPSYLAFHGHARRVWEARHNEALMKELGCLAWLRVDSEPAGAAVFLDGHRVGTTPYRGRACPGGHLIRLVATGYYPWQQLAQVPGKGELGLRGRLYGILPAERPPGSLILSSPAGASVFVEGREVGRTPVFVPGGRGGADLGLVAVAAEGRRPLLATPRPAQTLWFYLQPQVQDDARSR